MLARDELATGHVVSTVLLRGTPRPYETIAFGPGWPRLGDELVKLAATHVTEALANHAALVERFAPSPGLDPTDPNWVFRLLGLPPRRYPRTRP